jgi:hypothetical protein
MMVELWVIFVMLCLLIATGSALAALRLQYRLLDKTRQEREAWQQAQEGRQRTWEVRQGKHILDAEKKLADQLKDTRREWRAWSMEVEQTHQTWLERADIEKEVARLPHVEQLELSLRSGDGQRLPPESWRPPLLYQADLRGRDLAYRYMERADLREARLTGANLYMADLTGALLSGANLENANLTGANLCGADLRGANLSGASFLVTDLHHALLYGAILLGARHLSIRQLQAAFYDSTTVLDSSLDATLPRLPGIQISPADLPSISQCVQASATDPEVPPAEEGAPAGHEVVLDSSGVELPLDVSGAQVCAVSAAHREAGAPEECPPGQADEQRPAPEVPDAQVCEVSAAHREAGAPEECPPGQVPTPDVLTSASGRSEQAESGKIIQISVRAARTARQPGAEKRTSAAKSGGRKGKSAPNRSRKSSG